MGNDPRALAPQGAGPGIMTEHETPHAGTRPDAPAAVTADMEAQIARARKRMRRWIMLVAILGMAACTVVLAYGKHRTIYRDHYEFRSIVQPGMTEDDVVARFGPPYRIYWTPTQVAPIFAGRGVYDRFDRDVSPDGDLPAEFAKVLHYRPTLTHGEFVFIGADGVVLMVVTGRTGGS